MGVIFDTSVLIAAERNRFDQEALFRAYPDERFHLASITVSELLHGLERCERADIRERRTRFIDSVLARIPVLGFGQEEARHHARNWAELEPRGERIGAHDLLVAATAICHDLSLATLNQAEFGRVPGLRLLVVGNFVRA
jgi:predicted nucleic acid-binding protein